MPEGADREHLGLFGVSGTRIVILQKWGLQALWVLGWSLIIGITFKSHLVTVRGVWIPGDHFRISHVIRAFPKHFFQGPLYCCAVGGGDWAAEMFR